MSEEKLGWIGENRSHANAHEVESGESRVESFSWLVAHGSSLVAFKRLTFYLMTFYLLECNRLADCFHLFAVYSAMSYERRARMFVFSCERTLDAIWVKEGGRRCLCSMENAGKMPALHKGCLRSMGGKWKSSI